MLDDVAERQAVGAQPSGERPAGVDFRRVQRPAAVGTREAHLPRPRRQARAQHVAERVRRIGGDHQDPASGGSRRHRRRRGAGGLADAAFAGVESESWQEGSS